MSENSFTQTMLHQIGDELFDTLTHDLIDLTPTLDACADALSWETPAGAIASINFRIAES
jgi:hypothetical protein